MYYQQESTKNNHSLTDDAGMLVTLLSENTIAVLSTFNTLNTDIPVS